MTFTIHDMPQRSDEWFSARLGKLTGSCAKDMLSTIKSGGEASGRRNLRVRLMLERITQKSQEDDYINADMQRGIDLEPAALAAFEMRTGLLAMSCGFVSLDGLPVGCSPDGYCGEWTDLVSLKCPKSATHLGYLLGGGMPAEYVPQMLHELWVTGAQRYHFLSFDDRFPEELHTFYVCVERDELAVKSYELAARLFLSEVDKEVETVRGLMAQAVA